MGYQLCRWYDPYPQLAFALKMLYFAPRNLQTKAMTEIQKFVDEQWETVHIQRQLQATKPQSKGNRWYDVHAETAKTVELIKNSPENLKQRIGETLLAILTAEAA